MENNYLVHLSLKSDLWQSNGYNEDGTGPVHLSLKSDLWQSVERRVRKDGRPGICELAKILGVNRSTLTRIFKGLRPCSPELRAGIEAHGWAVPRCRVPKGV